jgi:hypothetical protein
MADARAFYDSYVRRHFADDPAANPNGVMLTRRNLDMMRSLIPWYLRPLGFGRAPLIAMQMTLGDEGMQRVGQMPLAGYAADRALFDCVLRLVQREEVHHAGFFSRFGATMLQGMIEYTMGGQVTFLIPNSLAGLHALTTAAGPAVARR